MKLHLHEAKGEYNYVIGFISASSKCSIKGCLSRGGDNFIAVKWQ